MIPALRLVCGCNRSKEERHTLRRRKSLRKMGIVKKAESSKQNKYANVRLLIAELIARAYCLIFIDRKELSCKIMS